MILPIAFALAAPPADAPGLLTFEAPAAGVTRVRLPPDATGADPAQLGAALLLLDANGAAVPFSILTTESLPWNAEGLDLLQVDTHVWKVGPSTREVRELEFPDFIGGWHPGELTIDGVGRFVFPVGVVDGEATRFDAVPVPAGRGPWIVRSSTHLDSAVGRSLPDAFVAPDCVTIDPGSPALTESGFGRYSLDLGGPRRVRSLAIETDADLFAREVAVSLPGESQEWGSTAAVGKVSRLRVGTASFDSTRIEGLDLGADALVFDVRTDAGRFLPITSVEVCSIGAELLVRDPGPGPFSLYVGGTGGGSSTDLAFAGGDLVSLVSTQVGGLTFGDNPAYLPRETREGVDAPGAVLPLVKWRLSRAVQGAGWLRIPLDRDVLAHARSDLADVRLVDAEDRQVPFVLRNTGREALWPKAEFTREEEGSRSLLRVPVGLDEAAVGTVRLKTSRGVFSRNVTIFRDRGAVTEPLRSVTWSGEEQGVELAIALNTVVGEELLIQVENGDNAPLEIEDIALSYPEWEVRARVPEGSRLVYGAARQGSPVYDLSLLSDELVRRRLAVGALGPAEAIQGAALPAGQRVVVLLVVGALAVGLLLMLLRLVLGKRVEDDAAAPEPPAGSAPGAPPSEPG